MPQLTDLFEILSEFNANNKENENQMVLAATQVEQNFSRNTAIMQKMGPQIAQPQTFQNCTFGNIGTINIHIHKS